MGQYTSTLSSTTSSTTDSNLELENRRLRKAIIKIRDNNFAYLAKLQLQDEQYKQELVKIEEMMKNPQPPTDPVEAEFERPILKNTKTLQEELQKFAEFITGNMDTILAAPELTSDTNTDEVLFMQLVNSAGFEYARSQVAKSKSTTD